MTPRRPCIERLADGRGCPRYAIEGGSRCDEHEQAKNREHYERVSPGTTPAWKKTVARIKRRARKRCERCGRPERKVNGRSTHQVHHLDGSKPGAGGSIRTPTPDNRLLYVCRDCHTELHREMRERKLREWEKR